MGFVSLNTRDNKVIVGRLGAPHGVKGWIKVQSFTEVSEDLFNYGPLSFLHGKQWRPLPLDESRAQGKIFIAKLRDCNDRDMAATFTNCELGIDVNALPAAADDEVYWYQLEGMKVVSVQGDVQQLLGRVDLIMETGANDVISVKPCEGSIDKQARLIPYVDHVVLAVDIEKAEVTVDWDSDF